MQPEASSEAGIPVSAADAALSLALAHLKRATAARDKPSQAPRGLVNSKHEESQSEITQTVQAAWGVYSRCVEVSLNDAVCMRAL